MERAYLVDEAGFTDVRVAGDHDGASVGVDGGQTRQVLANFLQVAQRGPILLHDGAHATQSRALQLCSMVVVVGVVGMRWMLLCSRVHIVAVWSLSERRGDVGVCE